MKKFQPTKRGEYYEAIIQLRPANDEILRFIKNRLKERPAVFISKVVEHKKDGLDLYISSQKYAQVIGKGLGKSFKGDVTLSRTLFTRNWLTSKDVYRLTILFRLRPEEKKESEGKA